MTFDGIEIEVVRKAVRRLSLRVYAGGKVRLTVPWLMPRRMAEAFVAEKGDWLKATFARLKDRQPRVLPTVSKEERQELECYLAAQMPEWLERMGEAPVTWKLRNMKTQWGNCRAQKRLITFNLQLAKQSDHFREYIVVHELCHLKEQNHGPAFKAQMDRYLPDWRERKKEGKQNSDD